MKDPRQVTPAEFAIIEVLWSHPEDLPVSAVRDRLSERRDLAYTTVMTLLDKMRRKGSVKRRKRGKAYYYSPRVGRQEVLNFLVQQFANSYCHGRLRQLEPFVRHGKTRPGRPLPGVSSTRAQQGRYEGADLDVELL